MIPDAGNAVKFTINVLDFPHPLKGFQIYRYDLLTALEPRTPNNFDATEIVQRDKNRYLDALSDTVMVKSLSDLKWKKLGDGYEFVAYTTEKRKNHSEFRKECRELSADFPAIPSTREI